MTTETPATDINLRLSELKSRRDALIVEINLIEDGIRKASYDASLASQLLTINEGRARRGMSPLSMTAFLEGDSGDE